MPTRTVNLTFGLLLLIVVGLTGGVHCFAATWLYKTADRAMYLRGPGLESQVAIDAILWAFLYSIPAGIALFLLWGVAYLAAALILPPDHRPPRL